MAVRFDVTKEDVLLIGEIADRAEGVYERQGVPLNRIPFMMDVTAVHQNGCPLNLKGLLAADAFDFSHDIAGIVRHIDRETGELAGGFLPRYAA